VAILALLAFGLYAQNLDIPNRAQQELERLAPGTPSMDLNPLYWDENYYVRIAHSQAQGQWIDPCWPDRDPRPQRWDHPPLARLILTASVALFDKGAGTFGECFYPAESKEYGYTCYTDKAGRNFTTGRSCMDAFTDDMRRHGNPWAWRLPGALMATVAVLCTALTARKLAGSTAAGMLAGGFLMVEGLFFVQARMATLDIFATGFAAVAVWLATFPTWRGTVAAAATLGLAFASKNTAFMAGLPVLLVHTWALHRAGRLGWRRGTWAALCIVALPGAVWVLSYLPWWILWTRDQGFAFAVHEWLNVQKAALRWNAYTPKPLHSERAQPETWFLLHRPMFYFRSGTWPEGALYIIGYPNPVVWWGGALASLGGLAALARRLLRGPAEDALPSARAAAHRLPARLAMLGAAAVLLLGSFVLAVGATADGMPGTGRASLLLLAAGAGALGWATGRSAWSWRGPFAAWRPLGLGLGAALAAGGAALLLSPVGAAPAGAAFLAAGAAALLAVHWSRSPARHAAAGALAVAAGAFAAVPLVWSFGATGMAKAGGLVAFLAGAPGALPTLAVLLAALAGAAVLWRIRDAGRWARLLLSAAGASAGVALAISGSSLVDMVHAAGQAAPGESRTALVALASFALQATALGAGALAVAAAVLHAAVRLPGTPAQTGAAVALLLLPLCYAAYFVLVLQSFVYYFMVGVPFLALALGVWLWAHRHRPEAFAWLGGGIFAILFAVTLASLAVPDLQPRPATIIGMGWAGMLGVIGLAGWAFPAWRRRAATASAILLALLALAAFAWWFPILEGLPVGPERYEEISATLPWAR
jgi:hypothetical protein